MLSAEDERQISAVILRYGTAIDRRDWTLFRTCFAEDVDADYGSFGHWRGCEEIAGAMEESHKPVGATLHRMTNIVAQGSGDRATARTYVDALLMPREPGGQVHRGVGYYDDELARTAQGWKIARRRFVSVQLT